MPAHRAPRRALGLLVALAAVLSVFTVLYHPVAARADGGPGLEYSGGGGSTTTTNPPPPPPSGSGGSSASPLPTGQYWAYDSGSFSGRGPHPIPNSQKVCYDLADGRWAIGWTRATLSDSTNGDNPVETTVGGQKITKETCNYQPASVVGSKVITCPVHLDGRVSGPTGPNAAPASVIASISKNSGWANGGKTATSCNESLYGAVAGATMKPGWWDLHFVYQQQSAVVRTYGGTQPDVIISYGPVVSFPFTKNLTVHCSLPGGWRYGKVGGLDFDPNNADSCRNSGPLGWSCTTSPLTGLDNLGTGPEFEILDDGNMHQATWAGLQVAGVKNLSDLQTHFKASGTPLRSDVSLNSHHQPMVLARTDKGTDLGLNVWMSGEVRSTWVDWQEAGYPTKPSRLDRTVAFAGDFPVTQVTLTGIDYMTGAVSTSTSVVYQQAKGTCPSQPLLADIVRARTSN